MTSHNPELYQAVQGLFTQLQTAYPERFTQMPYDIFYTNLAFHPREMGIALRGAGDNLCLYHYNDLSKQWKPMQNVKPVFHAQPEESPTPFEDIRTWSDLATIGFVTREEAEARIESIIKATSSNKIIQRGIEALANLKRDGAIMSAQHETNTDDYT